MWVERCSGRRCRRPYQVNEFGGKSSDLLAPGEIICPHCGRKEVRWSTSIFLAHALSLEEESDYAARFPLRRARSTGTEGSPLGRSDYRRPGLVTP